MVEEDISAAEQIKQHVESTFRELNDLEEVIERQYAETPDDPAFVLQTQAIQSTRNVLNKAFPYSDDVPSEEDESEDVAVEDESEDESEDTSEDESPEEEE